MKQSDSSGVMMHTLTLESLFTDAPGRKNTQADQNNKDGASGLECCQDRDRPEIKFKTLKV